MCAENHIDINTFIVIANLYNGFYPSEFEVDKIRDVNSILVFLKNSHLFYLNDKYPELKSYIDILNKNHQSKDIQLIEKFFNDYFDEVLEHLKYEEEIAFPYFYCIQNKENPEQEKVYSTVEYRSHHTDIETKLADLKNLFLKHIKIKNDLNIKRRFLNTLFGLEFDLKIHSVIEEKILIPVIERFEADKNG